MTPVLPSPQPPSLGFRRVVIADIRPAVDGGRYPTKRVAGDRLAVSVDLVADGHDHLCGDLLVRASADADWVRYPLEPQGNDLWQAACELSAIGRWSYTVEAWVDAFATWRWGIERKAGAGVDVSVEMLDGARLVREAAARAAGDDRAWLEERSRRLAEPSPLAERVAAALDAQLSLLMRRYPDRSQATRHEPPLDVVVDPVWARFSAWYELFPRSWGEAGRHGTFDDVAARLDYVASLGFDVLYLPPVHPIGHTHRKGRNNVVSCEPNDPGSPWAIGAAAGGHEAVHPELGTVEGFRRLVDKAQGLGIKVAIDIALQASPDHPYVKSHPEWFVHRADGSIQYAENPPKKYQDVYPFDFAGPAWRELWTEMRGVFVTWIERGVRIFRVDNPHTKPIAFWQWCIESLKADYPDLVFLAEAFTRPKMMYALAKVGFSQSYTYFTWRTTKAEIEAYLRELTSGEIAEFFRPNFWPNTPDILPEHLQFGGRPAHLTRAVLASTLSSNWGIYGPVFELLVHQARPGSEEYLDNEKYELRTWNLQDPQSLAPVLRRLNRIRRESPALQSMAGLAFHPTDNEYILCYSKRSPDDSDVILVVVNLDPGHRHTAWITLDHAALGADPHAPLQTHDLIGDGRYLWQGPRAFVDLDPGVMPAHVLRVYRKLRRENAFEYFL
ncbi:MAG: alpha-1,4-glucan--maltose-1-phosphate maltosyltransferase [Deltaproteobacteria bacterium]|nr:alpha-1,4-glucan--maltose-1-phosphate maltosyltransferase [Deltaproteobacteria bacterium]